MEMSQFDKKVMIISNSLSGGGAEISMMRLFHSLQFLGVDVKLCAINVNEITSDFPKDVRVIGRKWKTGLKSTISSLIEFRNYLNFAESDIVIVNCELPELYVALGDTKRHKIIVVEHTSKPWLGRKALGVLVRLILKLRHVRWVTVSRDQTTIWPFHSQCVYIPNSHIQPESVERISSDITFVGRFTPGKNPEMIAEAGSLTNSSVAFFGSGPELEGIREKFAKENFQFLGFVQNPWSRITPDSIVIVASDFEGDGMNVVEAVSNGNPILLRDNFDLRRFKFPNENYFSSLENLVFKINHAKLHGVQSLRISESISSNLLSERDPIQVAKNWITVMEGCFKK